MSKSLAKTSNKKKLMWSGAKELMGAPKDQQEARERQTIELVAMVLACSPYGVNVLGGQPYMNNLGRKDKMYQYDRRARFEYNWVQRALDDQQKAICEARIVVDDSSDNVRPLTPWIVGECSDATMGMKTLHGYQNHMAQTRAENRAFQYLFGLRLHHDMLENLAIMREQQKITKEQEQQVAKAATVSAEEIQNDAKRIAGTNDVKQVKIAEILKVISTKDPVRDRAELERIKSRIIDGRLYTQQEKSTMVELIDMKLGV